MTDTIDLTAHLKSWFITQGLRPSEAVGATASIYAHWK